MTTVEALLATRDSLQAEYKKDIEAIDHLLSRMGYRNAAAAAAATKAAPIPTVRTRTSETVVKEGSLRDWVNKAFLSYPKVSLSAPVIYDWAIREGAEFPAGREKTITSFGNVLRAMTREKQIDIVTSGAGRRPTNYSMKGEVAQ
jgi:hypothetical protein